MLVIDKQRHSKLLPTLALVGIFALSFISSASILYALDPKTSDSVHYTPTTTSVKSTDESVSGNSKNDADTSDLVPQDSSNPDTSNRIMVPKQPNAEATSDRTSSGTATNEPSRETPTTEEETPAPAEEEQPENNTTATRSYRRHKSIFDLLQLGSFLGIRL